MSQHAAGDAAQARSGPLFAYVGSFTSKERKARGNGINVYRVDRESGAWTPVQNVPDLVNPSFLAVDAAQRHLYSVHADLPLVTAFRIDRETRKLTRLNEQSMGGKNGVHLAIDRTGRWIVTANYAAGTVTTLPIEPDGSLGPLADTLKLPGEPGPHRTEQASAHPHHSPFDPSGKFVVVPDKGLDRVFVLKVDAASGKLSLNEPGEVKSRSGAGPRHISWHPSLAIAYGVNEIDSTVTTYAWDGQKGTLTPKQVITSLPTDFTGNSTASEIEVAASGRFVYASNRGHDSIVVFAADPASGLLSHVQWQKTQGRKPRFFALDPAQNLLHAANEQDDTIVTFRVDAVTGRLSPTGQVVQNASPACIVFVEG
jgi:6-phosphogluconolactonase (cycloisomerase 2 family)